MEKFALLNLIKALDGLKGAQQTKNSGNEADASPRDAPDRPDARQNTAADTFPQTPNLMYEAIMRHEQISNRLKNKK